MFSRLSKVIEKAEKYLSKYEDKVAQNTNSVLGKLISSTTVPARRIGTK